MDRPPSGEGNQAIDWFIIYPGILLIPALMFIEVRVIGRLFLSEMILAGLLPFLLLYRGRALFGFLPQSFLALAFFWLVSQVATDLYIGTPFSDLARGWAKIINTMINFMAIYLLTYGSRRRIDIFAFGVTIGYFLIYLFNPGEQMEEDPWKFGLGLAVTLLFCNIASIKQIYRTGLLPILCMLVPAALSLAQASRSLAGISFLATVYVFFQFYIGGRQAKARLTPMKTVMLVAAAIGGVLVLLEVYGFVASQGLLGREAQYKYEMQSQGEFGILLGGRAEIFVSIQAISDSPIVGHGSWAKDPRYAAMLLKLENYGYEISSLSMESGLIPSHSHLFGAWVEAGILGAIFWLWVIFLIMGVMVKLSIVRESLSPLVAFAGLLLLWDVLFSPFGAERRILIPFYLVILMAASKFVDEHWAQQETRERVRAGVESGELVKGWWGKFVKKGKT
ncbi:MAG: hypothetical protein HOO00_08800 [Rhodospirillaceae bacterium]|jgi:hypothetical protein|nr:hypothetical protein [Rhodospirillaceae bacterium]MBT5373312.1 hypothetical protein [Rhodospirillaceae bacterium]MBT5659134.1 hypothetical protein [Rhodospirillaceae bacterium]MBT5752251.1 hypothetical protein [Rhodospirillaceae bacterium]